MTQLREHSLEDPRCAECQQRDPVGPCAACEAMICGECGVLTKDPNGTKCICLSCARLVATVEPRTQPRSWVLPAMAIIVLLAFGTMVLSALAN